MYLMHGDMQGSAVAVGTLLALARSGAPLEIDCWLALTENQIGPRAYRPQEIVQAMNGVTIQVVHSDAEGRMVLADTLTLASRAKPRLVLDFATLTGACVNAITERYSGAFTNRPELRATLERAGQDSGERVWCFPLDEDFDTELEHGADVTVQRGIEGGPILAARFWASSFLRTSRASTGGVERKAASRTCPPNSQASACASRRTCSATAPSSTPEPRT
jgi:leucyl aminopeptidase